MADESLQAYIAQLERERDEAQERFHLLIQATGQVVYQYDIPSSTLTWHGDSQTMFGYGLDYFGSTIDDWTRLIHPDDLEMVINAFTQCEEQLLPYRMEYRFVHETQGHVWVYDQGYFKVGPDGKAISMIGAMQDISALKQAETMQLERQAEIIHHQEQMLRELGTPLIPISEDALIMPIIGTIDNYRAMSIMETLLTGISEHQAEIAILDMTGMPFVDTSVAHNLLKTAKAAHLLGARVLFTGISPELAQLLVTLEIDLNQIDIYSTLQAAIADTLHNHE